MRQRRLFPTLVLPLSILGAALASTARGADAYRLHDDASYSEGCFEPCLCPVLLATDLEGSFELDPADASDLDPGWERYVVSDLHWTVGSYGELLHTVTGQGEYLRHPDLGRQELLLELSLDGETPRTYRSGSVPAEVAWPLLQVRISMNDLYCYDEVFEVVAVPEGSIPVDPRTTWSTLKSRY